MFILQTVVVIAALISVLAVPISVVGGVVFAIDQYMLTGSVINTILHYVLGSVLSGGVTILISISLLLIVRVIVEVFYK